MAMTSTAFAGGGFDIVIPSRAGVPIIINGIDASYAVIEGEWGLGKNEQVQPTIYGGRYIDPDPHVGHYYPSAGHMPGYGRLEIEPPPIAAAGRELSPIMVGAIHAAAGAVQCAGRSAADHLRAAGR